MENAVRYFSKTGNTKLVAEAIAKSIGTQAISVDSAKAEIDETVDVLFIGGALYAYGIDVHLSNYIKSLKKENIKLAVLFSTTWFSKHSLELMKKELSQQGIHVASNTLHFRGKPSEKQLKEAEIFAKNFLK